MKRFAFLALLLAFLGASASQDTVEIKRTFNEGSSDRFKVSMLATTGMGEAGIGMDYKVAVKKVYENGDADVEAHATGVKVTFNGTEVPSDGGDPPPSVMRIRKNGLPVGKAAGGSDGGFSMAFLRLAFFSFDKPMKVGETTSISNVDPDNHANDVVGTIKLEALAAGVATVVTNMTVGDAKDSTKKPLKIVLTSLIEVASGNLQKATGTVTDLPEQHGVKIDAVQFTMERVK